MHLVQTDKNLTLFFYPFGRKFVPMVFVQRCEGRFRVLTAKT